jgi:hypothetical protein
VHINAEYHGHHNVTGCELVLTRGGVLHILARPFTTSAARYRFRRDTITTASVTDGAHFRGSRGRKGGYSDAATTTAADALASCSTFTTTITTTITTTAAAVPWIYTADSTRAGR